MPAPGGLCHIEGWPPYRLVINEVDLVRAETVLVFEVIQRRIIQAGTIAHQKTLLAGIKIRKLLHGAAIK
jgi:hypothetical protein